MKTSYWITGAIVAAMGLTGIVAQAQDKPVGEGPRGERHGMIFGELDANGDGELTLEEMSARGAARFADADTDGDGMLNAEEMNAAAMARIEERTAKMIERMDKDSDGLLSPEEMQGRRDPARMFERVDGNDDGVVTQAEFDEAREKMRGHHGAHGKGGDHDRDDG